MVIQIEHETEATTTTKENNIKSTFLVILFKKFKKEIQCHAFVFVRKILYCIVKIKKNVMSLSTRYTVVIAGTNLQNQTISLQQKLFQNDFSFS